MTRQPAKLYFEKGSKPHALYTPIPALHHWKQHTKNDFDQDVDLGIIEKLSQGQPHHAVWGWL